VEPLGPTTQRCETVTTANGPSVDWVVVQDDAGAPAATATAATQPGGAPSPGATPEAATDWTFTTYGRIPAVEVHVPAAVAAQRSTSFLDALGPAIAAHTIQQRSCL
jgi:hypothetical protein